MKIRSIKITCKFLIDSLQGKAISFLEKIPADAELLDIKFDLLSRQIIMIIRSDSFEDIVDGQTIPEFNMMRSNNNISIPPTAAVKLITERPNVTQKVESRISKTGAPAKNLSLMEEEFSFEQRKLLNFSSNDNFVIVKPIKFLKNEWDEINEIVKSIGGRWVKGDIISYWEIPIQT